MRKFFHIKHRLALLLLLAVLAAPGGAVHAGFFPESGAGVVQPQVNWNSGIAN